MSVSRIVALLIPLLAFSQPGSAAPKQGGKPKAEAKKSSRAAELDAERSKARGLKKWRPERHMLDFGLSAGALIPGRSHGFFDSGAGQRPELAPAAFDLSARLEYFPLAFVGAGIEGGLAPTRSPELDVSTTISSFRAQVIGQLPYRVTPVLLLGGGLIRSGSPEPLLQAARGAFHWGGGLKFFVSKWVALRLDGRHVVAGSGSSRFSVGEVLLGLDITLRLRDHIGPRKPRDGDGDGDHVLDSKDPCPATPGSDGHGCPPHLRDRDDDGKKDNVDKCPKEAGDTPSGCPIQDKDGDAVADGRDSCIEEAESFNGWDDTDGCPDEIPPEVAAFSGVIRGINFESGQARISKSSYKLLDRAAQTLRDHSSMRIEIVGHTDDQGARDMNLDLSQRRAEAVKKHLVDKGVEEERILARGAGPDEPIADNKTKKGKAANRRIEFRLLGR